MFTRQLKTKNTMRYYRFILIFFTLLFLHSSYFYSQELVIGEERIEPGIAVVFEGAIKDMIMPSSTNLNENQTDIHIEARVNWDTKDVPKGTPSGGFVPYLHITAVVVNQKTKMKTFIDLIPHINLVDNFHYARNMSLPGDITDLYEVEFTISPPSKYEVALHMDWKDQIGKKFFETVKYKYKDVDFEEIAKASRR